MGNHEPPASFPKPTQRGLAPGTLRGLVGIAPGPPENVNEAAQTEDNKCTQPRPLLMSFVPRPFLVMYETLKHLQRCNQIAKPLSTASVRPQARLSARLGVHRSGRLLAVAGERVTLVRSRVPLGHDPL